MQDVYHQQYNSKPYQAPGAAACPKGHRGPWAAVVGFGELLAVSG